MKPYIEDMNLGGDEEFDVSGKVHFDYNSKWYNSDFATYLGEGILIFLLCLGIGTCCMLCNSSIKIGEETNKPVIEKVEQSEE